MKEMRGLLAECGVISAQGTSALHRLIATILAESNDRISDLLREILSEMKERLRLFEEPLKRYDLRIAELARVHERAGRRMPVQGVGPLTATALMAAVGDARQFLSNII